MSDHPRAVRRFLTVMIAAAALGLADPRPGAAGPPPLGHVFIVVLENTLYSSVTPASMPYLTSLAASGVTLDQMYAVDHASLSNYIAMTSGKVSNALTRADCFFYNCVYEDPNDVSIADELENAGLTWKGYMESMPMPCAHGTEGSLDPYLVGYATRHNPFMYYRDIVGNAPRCNAHDVPYTDLATDLANDTVPSYALIVPNTCNDAHDGGASCGLDAADAWLATNLPPILGSAAFADRGVLIVTFDESIFSDTTGCCGNSQGGHIATFVIGPLAAVPGGHSSTPYNHYSLLRTVEDGFGLPCLDKACDASITAFGPEVLTRCGNSMIDPGEDCDPGADVAGDCCSPSCVYDTPGTFCTDASDACAACNAGGTCTNTPIVGFPATDCRLDVLIADVTSAPDIDATLRRQLLQPVKRAKVSVDRAQTLLGTGATGSAALRLRFASRRLSPFFDGRVSRLAERGLLSTAAADRLRTQGSVLVYLIDAL